MERRVPNMLCCSDDNIYVYQLNHQSTDLSFSYSIYFLPLLHHTKCYNFRHSYYTIVYCVLQTSRFIVTSLFNLRQ